MNRITISFQPEAYKKLQENAGEKKITINQYVRELVNIGLRVEEAASKNDGEGNKNSVSEKLDAIQDFIKKHLTVGYENLYLSRYLVTKSPENTQGENSETLKTSKEKSKSFVDGMFSQE